MDSHQAFQLKVTPKTTSEVEPKLDMKAKLIIILHSKINAISFITLDISAIIALTRIKLFVFKQFLSKPNIPCKQQAKVQEISLSLWVHNAQ